MILLLSINQTYTLQCLTALPGNIDFNLHLVLFQEMASYDVGEGPDIDENITNQDNNEVEVNG